MTRCTASSRVGHKRKKLSIASTSNQRNDFGIASRQASAIRKGVTLKNVRPDMKARNRDAKLPLPRALGSINNFPRSLFESFLASILRALDKTAVQRSRNSWKNYFLVAQASAHLLQSLQFTDRRKGKLKGGAQVSSPSIWA